MIQILTVFDAPPHNILVAPSCRSRAGRKQLGGKNVLHLNPGPDAEPGFLALDFSQNVEI